MMRRGWAEVDVVEQDQPGGAAWPGAIEPWRPAPSYPGPGFGPAGYPPGYPAPGYPAPGYPVAGSAGPGFVPGPAMLPPSPRIPGLARPVAVRAIPNTPFAVAVVGVSPVVSGPSVASLVAGTGSIVVGLMVTLFAVAGAKDGWGPVVSGAFAILAGLMAVASIMLGLGGLRQVARASQAAKVSGRGLAITGMICAGVGLVTIVLSMAYAFIAVG
jgi:hypothetical protein